MDRILILGASRGLGAELVKQICAAGYPAVGFGRKQPQLARLREEWPLFEYQLADFAATAGQNLVLSSVLAENFSKIFYVAGGGPFGLYSQREWKDHQWAWEVTFQFPARLLHVLANAKSESQVTMVGSAVAESSPDPLAASYSAAKHALLGLVHSLRAERPEWDLRLFSPGYMDTELLPKNAAVRQLGVFSPSDMARDLWLWSLRADDIGHKVYPRHPS